MVLALVLHVTMWDCVVVGAGCSGLACAQDLIKQGLKVLVLEANDYVGGRVRPVLHPLLVPDDHPMRHATTMKAAKGDDPLAFDVGAEFVHGDTTELHHLAQKHGLKLRRIFTWAQGDGGPSENCAPDGGAGYYYFGHENKLVRFDTHDEDLEALSDAIDEVDNISHDDPRDMRTYLKDEGLSRRAIAMAHAGYSNTVACGLSHISVAATARLEVLWDEDGGDSDFRYAPSMAVLIECLSKTVDVRLCHKVRKIQHKEGSYVLTVENDVGESDVFESRQVVITVPVTLLRQSPQHANERICFDPPLPKDKLDAIDSILMNTAMKIVIRFRDRFWPSDLHGMICADCNIPEVWVKNVGRLEDGFGNPLEDSGKPPLDGFIVVGFASSAHANNLSVLTEAQAIRLFVDQLNTIFATSETLTPASDAFVGGFLLNWKDVPYVRGAYTSPGLFESKNSRHIYGRSENEHSMHFAGEGSDFEHAYCTVHSAIRTGHRAAREVLTAIETRPSL